MSQPVTIQTVMQRVKENLGAPWKPDSKDKLYAGSDDTQVTGIVTTFAPNIDILHRAVEAKANLVICRESPYWIHEGYAGGGASNTQDLLSKDPAYASKRDFIQSHGIAIWKFSDNWQSRKPDGQLTGLARALGWEKHQAAAGSAHFKLPASTAQSLADDIEKRLKIQGLRVIGDPRCQISNVALMPGLVTVAGIGAALKDSSIDAVVVGEPVEWEAAPYFEDVIASGQKKAMLIIGQQASEEPGCGEVATWMKSFIPEVRVEWLAAPDPFWIVKG